MKPLLSILGLWLAAMSCAGQNLMAEGDSITASYFRYATVTFSNLVVIYPPLMSSNFAVSGSTFSDVTNRAPNVDAAYVPGVTNILSLLLGANDLMNQSDANVSNFVANEKGYFIQRKVVHPSLLETICTPLPRIEGTTNYGLFEHQRLLARQLIMQDSSWYNGLVDFGNTNTVMGNVWNTTNTTLYSDGIHPAAPVGVNYQVAEYQPVVMWQLFPGGLFSNVTVTTFHIVP